MWWLASSAYGRLCHRSVRPVTLELFASELTIASSARLSPCVSDAGPPPRLQSGHAEGSLPADAAVSGAVVCPVRLAGRRPGCQRCARVPDYEVGATPLRRAGLQPCLR